MKKALIFLTGLGILLCCEPANRSTKKESSYYEPSLNWYEGGTLHKATILEWKNATVRNKVATCADFAANIDKSVTMDELKDRAYEIMYCIDEATKGIDEVNNQKVSEFAILCAIQLGLNINQ